MCPYVNIYHHNVLKSWFCDINITACSLIFKSCVILNKTRVEQNLKTCLLDNQDSCNLITHHYVQENGDSVGWVKFHFHLLSFDARGEKNNTSSCLKSHILLIYTRIYKKRENTWHTLSWLPSRAKQCVRVCVLIKPTLAWFVLTWQGLRTCL